MFPSLILCAVIGLGGAFAVPAPVCSKPPFRELTRLAGYPPAQSFCSEHFPPALCTSTVSSTLTIVPTITTTQTDATSTTTTGTLSKTVVVTAVSTAFSTGTSTVTVTTGTVTVTVTTGAPAKRAATALLDPRADFNDNLLSGLKTAAESVISVACSCIMSTPPCATVTAVTTTTAPPVVQTSLATAVISAEAIESITTTQTDVITVTTLIAATTSVAATSTVQVAAPKYTQVAGPYDGCGILHYEDWFPMQDITSKDDASRQSAVVACAQRACNPRGDCNGFYLQWQYNSYWACWLNKKPYVFSASDLQCNVPSNPYGLAYYYMNDR